MMMMMMKALMMVAAEWRAVLSVQLGVGSLMERRLRGEAAACSLCACCSAVHRLHLNPHIITEGPSVRLK